MVTDWDTYRFMTHALVFIIVTLFNLTRGDEDVDSLLQKLDVWKVAPLNHGEENPDSKVVFATTAIGDTAYSLACIPCERGKDQCSALARVVGLNTQDMHYVELLDRGAFVDSFCTSDLSLISYHLKSVCNYLDSTGNINHVFDMRMSLEGTDDEVCRTTVIRLSTAGPAVMSAVVCDNESERYESLKPCFNRGNFPKAEDSGWKKKENWENLCICAD